MPGLGHTWPVSVQSAATQHVPLAMQLAAA
jgi:hypothetical protein